MFNSWINNKLSERCTSQYANGILTRSSKNEKRIVLSMVSDVLSKDIFTS